MNESVRDAVSQRLLKLCPDKLIGVKLRGITWETVSLETRMRLKKPLNQRCLMDRTSVPEKDDSASEVFKQMAQESDFLLGADISVTMKADVKSKSFSLGRNADSRDSRDFRPMSCRNKNRGLASGRPSSNDCGNKEESALVKEDQMGSKPIGLFLYAARHGVSSIESRLPVFPWLSWLVSGSSSPTLASDTRGWSWNSGYERAFGLRRQSVGASIPALNNRPPEGLWIESELNSVSLRGLTLEGDLVCVSTAQPTPPLFLVGLVPAHD